MQTQASSLIDYFNSLEHLSVSDKTVLDEHLKVMTLKKGNYFLEAGNSCDKIGYVDQGILRLFWHDKDGKEFSHCFIKEGGFVADMQSFYNQTVSSQYIIAETNCVLTTFTLASFRIFDQKIHSWQSIMRKATEKSLTEKVLEKSQMIAEDATTRYLNFTKRHPDIIQRVSLKSIACYLGMTQYSISRIRKKLSEEDFLSNGNSKV